MKIEKKVAILAVLCAFALSLGVSVQPVLACEYGCTPGFWKQPQHFGYWTVYSPEDTVGSVFEKAALYGLENDTLLEALDYVGGTGPEGAARILLRTAVASLLNITYDGNWGWGWWQVDDNLIKNVNERLEYGDRDLMLAVVEQELDGYNNAGCPFGEDW